MLEGMLTYLQSLATDTFIFRVAVISFAIVLTLTPPENTLRSWGIFLLRFLGVNVARHLLWMIGSGLQNVLGESLDGLALSWTVMTVIEFLENAAVVAGYSLIFCRYRGWVKASVAGAVLSTIAVTVNLSYSLGRFVDSFSDGLTIPMLILVYALLAVFALVACALPLERFSAPPGGTAVLFAVTDTVTVVMCTVFQVLGVLYVTSQIVTALVFVTLYVFLLTSYVAVYMMSAERERAYAARAENLLLRASAEQLELVKTNIKELHMLRHDLKNKYAYIGALTEMGEYGKLKEFVGSLSEESLRPKYFVDCGNYEVSSILTMESSKAESKGVGLSCDVMLPAELPFAAEDLCSLFSNLIDNAIEACVREGVSEPVTAQSYIRKEMLYVCVRNTLPENADRDRVLSLKTSKGDAGQHGYGTRIVRHIAEKYGGSALFDIAGGQFIAEAELDLEIGRALSARAAGDGKESRDEESKVKEEKEDKKG